MERNREGNLVGEKTRECTRCSSVFNKTSKTVTLCGSCNSRRVKEQDPETKMYRRAKSRALKSGIEFTLKKTDIRIPDVCPVFGVPLVVHKGSPGGKGDSPALDRFDNNLGYTPENTWVISHKANMMKGAASPRELVSFAEWVLTAFSGEG